MLEKLGTGINPELLAQDHVQQQVTQATGQAGSDLGVIGDLGVDLAGGALEAVADGTISAAAEVAGGAVEVAAAAAATGAEVVADAAAGAAEGILEAVVDTAGDVLSSIIEGIFS